MLDVQARAKDCRAVPKARFLTPTRQGDLGGFFLMGVMNAVVLFSDMLAAPYGGLGNHPLAGSLHVYTKLHDSRTKSQRNVMGSAANRSWWHAGNNERKASRRWKALPYA